MRIIGLKASPTVFQVIGEITGEGQVVSAGILTAVNVAQIKEEDAA